MNKPLPLYCLAGTDYFANIVNQKTCEISISEKYIKQSLRNRFYIMEPNKILRLSIPVKHFHQTETISEIKIDYSENTMSKNWKSIESSYRNSPYFEHYFDVFFNLFSKKHYLLAEFNIEVIQIVLKIIKSDTKVKLNPLPIQEILKIEKSKNHKKYNQVFSDRHGFIENLSIVDVLFNNGPYTSDFF